MVNIHSDLTIFWPIKLTIRDATIAKTKAYIDQLIEKDMATPQTQEDKIDRILDILERINKIAIEGNQECRIRFDIIIKPKEDTND